MSNEKRITPRPFREEQAWQEIGHTTYAPGVRLTLFVFFITFIVLVPLIQLFLPASMYAQLQGYSESAEPRQGVAVQARVAQLSSPPDANGVYSDFMMQLELEHIQWPAGTDGPDQLVVNVLGMQARELTAAASVVPGEAVNVWLGDWQDVAAELNGTNASELPELDVDMEIEYFAYGLRSQEYQGPSGRDFLQVWAGSGSDLPPTHRTGVLVGAQQAMQQADSALNVVLDGNGHLAKRISLYETALDDGAWTTLLLKSPVQGVMSALGVGNEKAALGHDGWLFYIPGVHTLSGPGFLDPAQLQSRQRWEAVQPDPRLAIINFRDQLAARGIELVLVLAPVKPSIHPEQLTSRIPISAAALRNRSMQQFMHDLSQAGVQVVDPTAQLRQAAQTTPQYLATDTHWRPAAMAAVAELTAAAVRPLVQFSGTQPWQQQAQQLQHLGDIGMMLELPDWQQAVSREAVTVQQIVQADGSSWRNDPEAELLILGDSFTNIFQLEAMGWGKNAGFAQQLAWILQQPIDVMARNDAGAYASRQLLVDALRADPWRLHKKKIVVWEVTERELALGDWKLLTLPDPPEGAPPAPASSEVRVASVADAPAAYAALLQRSADNAVNDVIIGANDWLHLPEELRFLSAKPFWGEHAASPDQDPLRAIVDLQQKLAALDIEFVLAPAPPRALLYADTLFAELPTDEHGLPQRLDPVLQQFYQTLRDRGVTVVDATDALLAARQSEGEDGLVSCWQDTHWSPRGLQIVARAVYDQVVADGEPAWLDDAPYQALQESEPETLRYVGDLAARLDAYAGSFSEDRLRTIKGENKPFAFSSTSPVVLLSDSHGMVFSTGADMHARDAGFGEHLSLEFGFPLDLMAQQGSGDKVRRVLARRFVRKPAEAAEKRLLIYSFAARTFIEGTNWALVPLQR